MQLDEHFTGPQLRISYRIMSSQSLYSSTYAHTLCLTLSASPFSLGKNFTRVQKYYSSKNTKNNDTNSTWIDNSKYEQQNIRYINTDKNKSQTPRYEYKRHKYRLHTSKTNRQMIWEYANGRRWIIEIYVCMWRLDDLRPGQWNWVPVGEQLRQGNESISQSCIRSGVPNWIDHKKRCICRITEKIST